MSNISPFLQSDKNCYDLFTISSLHHPCMKKLLSFSLGLSLAFTLSPSAFAQNDDYSRLYQEFLNRLQQEQQDYTQPASTSEQPAPAVYVDQAAIPTSQYSLIGKVTGDAQGRYYITVKEGKAKMTYRVYGQKMSKEIIRAALYEEVQLIGQKAYFNNKHVGISVDQVIPLVMGPKAEKMETVKVMTKSPMAVSQSFWGMIEVGGGKAYLQVMEGKKKMTYRLLNEKDWRKAFNLAYKGQVEVRGTLVKDGVIRFEDIWLK